jgi:hypothetical protein
MMYISVMCVLFKFNDFLVYNILMYIVNLLIYFYCYYSKIYGNAKGFTLYIELIKNK